MSLDVSKVAKANAVAGQTLPAVPSVKPEKIDKPVFAGIKPQEPGNTLAIA